MHNQKFFFTLLIFFCFLFIISGLTKRYINEVNYQKSIEFLDNSEFAEALVFLEDLENYKNANELIKEAESGEQYIFALECMDKKKYEKAIDILSKLTNFKDSKDKLQESKYQLAIQYFNNEEYDKAKPIFEELPDYKESDLYLDKIDINNIEKLRRDIYEKACQLFNEEKYSEALEKFNSILEYKDSEKYAQECKLQLKRRNLNNIISSGVRSFVAITNDSNAKGIAYENFGQCDLETWKNVISIDTYSCLTIGLMENKKVDVSGVYDNNKKVDVAQWENIIDIAAGEQFVVGLTEDGFVVGEGLNHKGQVTFEDWKNEKIVAIDAGWEFTVGLTENKKLLFTGVSDIQKADFEKNHENWKDVVNISAGGGEPSEKRRGAGHTVGLKSDGTVVAVGDNTWGQCDISSWTDIIKVVAGDWYTVGLKDNGTVLITGQNIKGTYYIDKDVLLEINTKHDIVDIAAGYGQTFLLHEDGSITTFGFDDFYEISTWKIELN